MDQTTGVRPWQWVVTAIVVIALIVLGVYTFGGKKKVAVEEEPTIEETTSTTAASANRVVVSDQFPGNIVYLSSVQLAQPGWVEIHKDNAGTPGAIIGSAWFDKGINPGKITLSESTKEGGVYYAMIHSDDGDKKFDAAKDLPLKNSAGSIIMQIFRATASAVEVKG